MSSYFQGDLVRLRAVEPDDWEAHLRWDEDAELMRYLDRVRLPRSRKAQQEWAEKMAMKEQTDDNMSFQIETLAGELVGSTSAHSCQPRVGVFNIGVGLDPVQRGKGYAGEAIALLLRYYFHELRYLTAMAYVVDVNQPSRRLFARLGFEECGRQPNHVYTGGEFHDYIIYAMTADAFDASGLIAPFNRSP